jgi:hypothetical protein
VNNLKYVAITVFMYLICIFLYGAYFSFPQTDDFCIFGRVISTTGNPLSDVYYMYLNWSGRYASMFFIALPAWVMTVSPVDMSIIYRLFVFLYIASFIASLYFFFKILELDKTTCLLFTLLISGLVLIILPSKVEGLYWLTGSAVYLLPVSAFMLLASVLQLEYIKRQEKSLPALATSLILITVVGFNELIAISAGLLIGFHFLFQQKDRRNNNKNIFLVLIFIGSMLVAVLAPGNFARSSTIVVPKHNIEVAFNLMISSLGMLWNYNIGLHKTVAVFAIMGGLLIGFLPRSTALFKYRRQFLAVPVSLIVGIPIHFFVYSFLTGEASPGRVLNQSTALLWIGILLLSAFISSRFVEFFSSRQVISGREYSGVLYFGLIIVSLAYLEHKEFKNLNQTLKVFAPYWASERDAREQRIKLANSSGVKILQVDPLGKEPFWPPFFSGTDLTEDPKYWVNMCIASYYHLEEISIRRE